MSQDLSGIPDKGGAQGAKEVVLHRPVPALGGGQVRSKKVLTNDGPVLLLEESNQFLDQIVDLESRVLFALPFLDFDLLTNFPFLISSSSASRLTPRIS